MCEEKNTPGRNLSTLRRSSTPRAPVAQLWSHEAVRCTKNITLERLYSVLTAANTSAEQEVVVSVITQAGKSILLRVAANCTIREVMKLLEEKEGIPISQQRLAHNGQPLSPEKSLAECKIGHGALLHSVLLRSPHPTRGRCHCGNISFELTGLPEPPAEITGRACGCTFCQKHGGVWASAPDGELRVAVKDKSMVSAYRFETKTADFHVCTHCGVVPVVTSTIDGHTYAVVSVNAFEDVDSARIKRLPSVLDGETEAARLARRKRGWISNVQFIAANPAAKL